MITTLYTFICLSYNNLTATYMAIVLIGQFLFSNMSPNMFISALSNLLSITLMFYVTFLLFCSSLLVWGSETQGQAACCLQGAQQLGEPHTDPDHTNCCRSLLVTPSHLSDLLAMYLWS